MVSRSWAARELAPLLSPVSLGRSRSVPVAEGMALASSATTAYDEHKRRRSSRTPQSDPLIASTPKGADGEEGDVELSLNMRKQFAQQHDKKGVTYEGGYRARSRILDDSSEDEEDRTPRAYDLALYDSDSGLQHTPPSGALPA
ncbi:unnamed protein product [Symbiodinium natans]|uniref:Uncharacterized protein n=1 Tax=Symbiodinium natans TaxID=878477 RepID=A0A812G654_9DINO|nr:unnamed protein product [Symbiodinium natans]